MPVYDYHRPDANPTLLHADLEASGLPYDYMTGPDGTGHVHVNTQVPLAPEEVARLDAVVAAHDPVPRRTRIMYDILRDVNALTPAQKGLIWTDLMTGSPPKLFLDEGPNTAAIAALEFSASVPTGITTAEKNVARARVIAMYAQDNVAYLVGPPFDPTIDIPGDEPYTP